MDLPPELVDEIISHVAPDDMESLRNCSLVAKTWVYPSRRRLFETVNTCQAVHLELWLGSISPTNISVLQHVRFLCCRISNPPTPCGMMDPADLPGDYSPSFRRLERLTLTVGSFVSLTQIGTPGFRYSLSYLCLWYCRVKVSAIVACVDYFPNLLHLDLCNSRSDKADDQPIPPLPRPLRKLTVTNSFPGDAPDLIYQFMELRPQCVEVTVETSSFSSSSFTQRIIDGVAASVKRLNLEHSFSGV